MTNLISVQKGFAEKEVGVLLGKHQYLASSKEKEKYILKSFQIAPRQPYKGLYEVKCLLIA